MKPSFANVDVCAYYSDQAAGDWSMRSLSLGTGVIAPAHLSRSAFWAAPGGLRILHDRFHTVLFTNAAGEIGSYARFLAGIVFALRQHEALSSYRSDLDDSSVSGLLALLVQEDGSRIFLTAADQGLVALSFTPASGTFTPDRLVPFFRDLQFDRSAFLEATQVALGELVQVFRAREGVDRDVDALISAWNRVCTPLLD